MDWYTRDTKFIPAQGIPLVVLDLCHQLDQDCHRVLRGTQLFLDDILKSNPQVSPQQLLRLIDNALQLYGRADGPFQLGQYLLPGQCGASSQALASSPDLYNAIELLVQNQALLTPLLQPLFYMDDDFGYLYWQDSCGVGKLEPALIESIFVAVVAYSRRMSQERLPWSLHFRHDKPRHIEQYWVHLGNDLNFNQPRHCMQIPRTHLFKQWQKPGISGQVALQQAKQQSLQLPTPRSLLASVYELLMHTLSSQANKRDLQLDAMADALNISSATLKRQLKIHGTGFQQQLDQARLHRALHLINHHKMSAEEVSRRLGFCDSAGFRRSFKRWTGFTPSHFTA